MAFWKKKKRSSARSTEEHEARPAKRRRILPLEVKILAVEARAAGLTAKEISEVTGSSPGTIDKWYKTYKTGGTEGLVRSVSNPGARKICSELERRIEQHRTDYPEHGVRRIRDELRRDDNVEVSAETVRRVVNDAGLGNEPHRSKPRPPQVRRFERKIPNAMWQIDIFTFELKRMYKVYLVGIIDDHSRYIVGHGLFRQQTADAVLEVVKGAIGQWGAPREILSDNGRQFVAWQGKSRFQKVVRREGIQHVRSAPHHPMTLGKIERFWRTIWDEFLEEAQFASFADAQQRLDHWVAYYNHQRPHQGIDGACPADRFYGVADDVEEATKHGCQENSLRLALGQETRPPLYLLGKLGETDVRVTRKGDDIEVKLGDSVHELIKLGTPFELDSEGNSNRGEDVNTVAGNDRRGEVPRGGAGAGGSDVDNGDLRDVWSESSDFESGDQQSEPGSGGGSVPEEERAQGEERGGAEDYTALEEDILFGKGSETLED